MNKRNAGFTLVEIMIVVAIIGLLAAIAIPSFVKARTTSQKNACINNLRQIDSAKEQWAMATKATANAEVTAAMQSAEPTATNSINEYIKGGEPDCPAGGTLVYQNIGSNPTCTVTEHILDSDN